MKPFQPRPLEQQRKNYVKACKQRMTVELRALEDRYRNEHDIHAKLYFNRCRLEEKVSAIQDRVADAADKEFGGWDKWRHDEALLKRVVGRMDEAVVDLREKIKRIDDRMDALMAEYRRECKAVSHKYHTLMKTA